MSPTTPPDGGNPRTRLLDVDEAAAYLNVLPGYVRRLVHEKRVPHLHVGKFLRFDQGDLDGWLQAHRQEPE